jgi:hypothetical protein
MDVYVSAVVEADTPEEAIKKAERLKLRAATASHASGVQATN